MKYVNTGVVFQEIPDEVTLSINISNCPCRCIGCHSQYLWDDIGIVLNNLSLDDLLSKYADDVTCVCFMGGDASPETINELARHVKLVYPQLKVGWYSGRKVLSQKIDLGYFNFVKLGSYIESLGGLDKDTTNQRLYKVNSQGKLEDITKKMRKKR